MPQIVYEGSNAGVSRSLASGLAGYLSAVEQGNEARRMGLAERQFEAQQEDSDRRFGLQERSMDLGEKRFERDTSRFEKIDTRADKSLELQNQQATFQKLALERGISEEDAERRFRLGQLSKLGDLGTDIELLRDAPIETIREVTNSAMYSKSRSAIADRVGSRLQRLSAKLGGEGAPPELAVVGEQLAQKYELAASMGTIEDLDGLGSEIEELELGLAEAVRDAEQRASFSSAEIQRLDSETLEPRKRAMYDLALEAYQGGDIDRAGYFDRVAKIESNQASAPTDRFKSSAQSKLGTEVVDRLANGIFGNEDADARERSARDLMEQGSRLIDSLSQDAQSGSQGSGGSAGVSGPKIPTYTSDDVLGSYGKRSVNRAVSSLGEIKDQSRREEYAANAARRIVSASDPDLTGDDLTAEIVAVAKTMLSMTK